MGKYTEIAQRMRKQKDPENIIDGHEVSEVLWRTDRMILFRDPKGNLWRHVHAWGMTWLVSVRDCKTQSRSIGDDQKVG